MLNKEVCKSCWSQSGRLQITWTDRDDVNWDFNQMIICPIKHAQTYNRIYAVTEAPPKHCPFAAEHAVSC
jgi:hypothetical protein